MIYIGSTTDYEHRVKAHLIDLKKGLHNSPKMQSDYFKYGIESFTFEVISTNNDIRKENQEYEILRSLDQSMLYNSHKGVSNTAERRAKKLQKALKLRQEDKPQKTRVVKKHANIKGNHIELTDEIKMAIKEYRRKNNLSQYDLGRLMGYCDAVIGNIERKDEFISENKAKILQSVTGILLIS